MLNMTTVVTVLGSLALQPGTAAQIAASEGLVVGDVQAVLDVLVDPTAASNPEDVQYVSASTDPEPVYLLLTQGNIVADQQSDQAATAAMAAAICTSATCENDVDLALESDGASPWAWRRGLDANAAIVNMLRCPELIGKMPAGIQQQVITLLNAAEVGNRIGNTMYDRYAQPAQ